MKKIVIILLILNSGALFGQTYPFPNHTIYTESHIKPNNYTQSQLDSQTQLFYDEWKLAYLKNDCGNDNEYYVFIGNGAKNVSEAQGYGMMIVAYLAGYDSNAQVFFDGLYQFYKSHPSNINSGLMDWQQVNCNDASSSDDASASDGDIDIAFALLLAHAQWGSNGIVSYFTEAQTIIKAVMQDEINQISWTVKLGDWSNSSDSNYYFGTRPSDFITDHFKTFACFNSNWNSVIDTCYSLITNMQDNYSATTGLIPDFIISVNENPSPASADYLEGFSDGYFSYNACRVPWRLGTDYLISGDIRAKLAIDKINIWLNSAVNGIASDISSGYQLNGTALYDWNDAAFIGPFAIGAMLNTANQAWLNNLYEELIMNNGIAKGEYYSNTIKLLSLIVISGNYWVPGCSTLNTVNLSSEKDFFLIHPNISTGNISIVNMSEVKNVIYRIVNIRGEVVMSNILSQNQNEINISSFKQGVYFVSIITNNSIVTKMIIKK